MSSFSMAVRPVIERPNHPIDDDAVDLTDTIDISGSSPEQDVPHRDTAYELRPIPSYMADRARRPSAIRIDSDATIVFKDANTEPPTPTANDTDKQLYTSATTTALPHVSVAIPSIHARAQTVSAEAARRHRMNSMIQFAAICWAFFLEGWNDGTTGPLLPTIQSYYHINYTMVSLLFVFNCLGFVLGAGMNVWLNERFGFGKTVVLGSLFQVAAYAIECPAPPFPAMVLAYFFAGFGMSLQNAQGNGFVGSLKKNQTIKINMLHAAYGVGAFVAPLVATPFSGAKHWSYHFIISTGIAVSNTAVLSLVFRFKRQEELFSEAGQEPAEGDTTNEPGRNLYSAIFGIKSVHFLAIFALIYIGVEVTLGGWIVTFIINEREGGRSAGYISSGFFGGLTLGRLVLIWFSKKVGEHRVVFLYSILAIALELTIWFVPSIIENALAVSLIGMLLGPMFPILVGHAARILPAWLLTGSVGWITGIGMSGSAALPFITGVFASKFGIRSLQPLVVSMMCTMVVVWALVPRAPRRID